jgi:Protein of unknown function (DUF1488)
MKCNPLKFPNLSRSYDAKHQCVRSWAHVDALEVPFFVQASAIWRIDPAVSRDELGLLSAFDLHRERICRAAGRVYSRHSRGSYTLSASDIK